MCLKTVNQIRKDTCGYNRQVSPLKNSIKGLTGVDCEVNWRETHHCCNVNVHDGNCPQNIGLCFMIKHTRDFKRYKTLSAVFFFTYLEDCVAVVGTRCGWKVRMAWSRRGASCYDGPFVDQLSVLTPLGQFTAAAYDFGTQTPGFYSGCPGHVLRWHGAGTVAV